MQSATPVRTLLSSASSHVAGGSDRACATRENDSDVLDRVRRRRERERGELEGRHHQRRQPLRRADRFDVPRREHRQHALVEAQVAHRVADSTLLDPPQAVAGEPGERDGAGIDQADVPEARDQETAVQCRRSVRFSPGGTVDSWPDADSFPRRKFGAPVPPSSRLRSCGRKAVSALAAETPRRG